MSVVEPNVLELLTHTEDRYTLTVAASKRARQLVLLEREDEDKGIHREPGARKPLQQAIEEINTGLLTFDRPAEEQESEEL